MRKSTNVPIEKYRLRDLRDDHGLSQVKLVEQLNEQGCPISLKAYQNYESGTRCTPEPVLIALARLYHVSVDFLLGLSDYTSPEKETFCKLTGLSSAAVETLEKFKDTTIVDALNLLIPRIGSDSDLLSFMSLYLYRPDGSNSGDVYFCGDAKKDIVLRGEAITDGGILFEIASKLTEYRMELHPKQKKRKSK